MLDILIPVYKEPKEMIETLLNSIAMQRGIDFSDITVRIKSDGVEDYEFSTYPFEIVYSKDEHRGVSETRNALLRESDAEYVMFCDDDDVFFSCLSLWLIFKAISTGCDAVISNFIEEAMNGWYIPHEHDGTFIHGKAYRRQFLLDNGILFDSRDINCEDSAFNAKVHAFCGPIEYISTPTYMWCCNMNSVTRSIPEYRIRNMGNWVDAMDRVCLFLKKNGKDYSKVVSDVIAVSTKLMNSDEWLMIDIPEQDIGEKKFNKFVRRWR